MKIVIFNAYYTPEIAAGINLEEDIAEGFAHMSGNAIMYVPTPCRGISDEVRKAYKNKTEELLYDGALKIVRYPLMKEGRNPLLRAARYFLQNYKQYRKGITTKDADAIFSGSTPPTQGAMCAFLKTRMEKKYKRKIPFVYNLQDVFPDSLVTTGLAKEGSLIWKVGRKVEDYTYRHADKIIVISSKMKENLLNKGVPEEKLVVVNNWITLQDIQPVAKEDNRLFEEFGIDRDRFTVVYAGNFGAAQGADVVLHAAKLLPDIQFVIFGGGAEFENAKELANELPNVIINGLLPADRVPEVYSLGDVCLITCKKGVGNSGMPSKTWSIMACNTPIIAAFDTDSELAQILQDSQAGICVEPEDPKALAEAIAAYRENPLSAIGSRNYVETNASKDICVSKYVEAMKLCLTDTKGE